MRVFVTGGTGFIGSHLVNALLERGDQVITLSRRPAPGRQDVEHFATDIQDAVTVERFGQIDAVVHLAASADASASLVDPLAYNRTNALGTLNMLELARQAGAQFVYASSQRIYQPKVTPVAEDAPKRPVDPYGYAKLIGEQWVQMYRELYHLPTVVLRFFSVYGPGQVLYGGTSGVVAIFVHRALAGAPLLVNDANLRDLTYVGDVVQGIILALDKPGAIGRTYNIATGQGTAIGDLAQLVKEVARSSSSIEIVGHASEESYVADIALARRELGYAPRYSLRQGLELYVG